MLIIISPAKTQDFNSPPQITQKTKPRFINETIELLKELKKLSVDDIKTLMNVSDKIAELNYRRIQDFDESFKSGKQAIITFKGDVYRPLKVDDYSEDDFHFAQKHLRMLSGFYGLLRPFDMMQAYRLEMKTKLKTSSGKDLYDFWGCKLKEILTKDLSDQGDNILINLASKEYSKALELKNLEVKIITPTFLEKQDGGEPRIVALFAKRARGMMTNFIIKNHLEKPDDLKKFNEGGYQYSDILSEYNKWVFIR